jgi:hypothetical protein
MRMLVKQCNLLHKKCCITSWFDEDMIMNIMHSMYNIMINVVDISEICMLSLRSSHYLYDELFEKVDSF